MKRSLIESPGGEEGGAAIGDCKECVLVYNETAEYVRAAAGSNYQETN